MKKSTNVFILLDNIRSYENEVGRSLTTEEKVAIIMEGLKKDTQVLGKRADNRKRYNNGSS